MITIESLTTLLGWCTLINLSLLLFATLFLVLAGSWVRSWHARLLDVAEADLPRLYFQYLGNYKLLVIVFNLVPYLVLRLIMS